MKRTPEELHRSAVDLLNHGRIGAAERLLATADRLPASASVRARIAGTRAYAMARRGDISGAEQVCAAALATRGVDRATRAVLTGQMGALAEQAGRLPDAERFLTRAIDNLHSDPVARANLLINRSLIHMQLRRLDAALRDTSEAAATYAEHDMAGDAAQALHNEGYISLLAGDLIAALQLMTRSSHAINELSSVAGAISDVDRAEVLRDAGLAREAEELLERASAVLGGSRMPRVRAEAEFTLARSLLGHDPVRARRVAGSATRRFEGLGIESWAARARALRLRADLAGGVLMTRAGEHAPSVRRAPRAAEVEETAGDLDRFGFGSEAAVLRMAAELWRARRGMPPVSARVRVPPRASLEVRLLAEEVRATRAISRGRDTEARRAAARGLDLLSAWQSDFGSLDLQTSIGMHGLGLIGGGLEAAVSSGRADVVFEWSERARHLGQQVVPLRPPPDPGLADDLAELRMMRADGPTALESPRAAELRERARERQWSRTGSAAVQERIGLEELRAELDADTAFITFVFSAAGLGVVVATADRTRFLPLDGWQEVRRALPGLRADLDMWASLRAGGLADVIRRSLDARLAELSSALLSAPLAAAGDPRRVVLTAPGVLNGIPWSMLPGMKGRASTLAVSATRWARLHAEPAAAPTSAGFVVGPRVPRGDEEVDDAADTWAHPRMLRAAEASVAAVTRLAHDVDVLHVAAHGRHAVDNPLFSGLELADGTLFGYDIDLIPEVPETVVLSACEVGRSSVRWGEEAIGMTRIWLHAGTRCVIASPVIVADDDACVLLGIMHEGLARGEAPAEALAAASAKTGIVSPFQAHGAGF